MSVRIATLSTPEALCGGGEPLAECETAQAMLRESDVTKVGLEYYKHPLWTRLAYLSRACLECGSHCAIDLESIEGSLTGEVRFTFTPPEPEDPLAAAGAELDPGR